MSKDDVVPGLLELIKNQIDEELKNNPDISHLIESIEDISKNFHNAYQFGLKSGQVVSNALVSTITVENLPNGQMYFNIANRILKTVLQEQYERMADYTTQVQAVLNQQSKLSIKAIKPQLNTSKIDGLVEILSREGDLENNIWAMKEPVVNFSQTIVDDTIKANAEFHYKAGLSPKIIRTSDGNCCDWCDSVVGVYKYPDVPKDVYRRHKNCGCEVNYYPGDGKYQNAHTKKWSDLSNFLDEESKYENEGNNRLKYLSYYFARELGLNPLTEEQAIKELRKQSREWIQSLTHDEVNAINKYTYNGKDSDGLRFFEKINGFLGGYYIPKYENELESIARNANHIYNALLKFQSPNDIIVYRKDNYISQVGDKTKKFISTSIKPEATLTGKPNVAIIIPKEYFGAYIESLSHDDFKYQLEFLININVPIRTLYTGNDVNILVVGGK